MLFFPDSQTVQGQVRDPFVILTWSPDIYGCRHPPLKHDTFHQFLFLSGYRLC
jgi:hypothetical protein